MDTGESFKTGSHRSCPSTDSRIQRQRVKLDIGMIFYLLAEPELPPPKEGSSTKHDRLVRTTRGVFDAKSTPHESELDREASAITIPAEQGGLGIDRPAVDVDLEVQVAADRDRVAGLSHRSDSLAGIDALAPVNQRRPRHVGVEVGAVLAFAVDQQVVAVENRVIAAAQDFAAPDCHQRGIAGGDDVEALMGAAATAGGAEFADWATGAVGALNREDVAVVGEAAVG
jgi:hypothetical protein